MCGLTGVISSWLSKPEIEAFRQLMVLASLRGRNGSGITAVPQLKKRDVEILRSEGSASDLAYDDDFEKLLSRVGQCTLLMGHARLPTRGGVFVEDAHPHTAGNIIGMHNGTMKTVNGQKVGKDDNDSRMLFQAINDVGFEQAIKNSEGEYALSWIDLATSTLHFFRNTKRELWFGFPQGNQTTVYWASEPDFLELLLGRTYLEPPEIMELTPFFHITFALRNGSGDIKPKGYYQLTWGDEKKTSVPIIHQSKVPTGPAVRYKTRGSDVLTGEELSAVLDEGCAYCETPQTFVDFNKGLAWIDKDEFICTKCLEEDPQAFQYAASYGYQGPITPKGRH